MVSIAENGSREELREKLCEVFSLKESAIHSIQVFDAEWDDWLDIEDELPASRSKLQVTERTEVENSTAAEARATIQPSSEVECMEVDKE